MTQLNKFTLIFTLIFNLFSWEIYGQVNDSVDQTQNYKFADYLYRTQQYEFASEEFSKLVFTYPENNIYKKQLLESFRMGKDYSQGIKYTLQFLSEENADVPNLFPEYIKFKLLSGYTLPSCDSLIDTNKFATIYHETQLLNWMINYNWKEVQKNRYLIQNSGLYSFTLETPEKDYKNPFIAGGMSAIIPGSGKFYSGRWKDGLTSLLFVGITAYQSYRGFSLKGNKSAYGWIYGGLAMGFYIGNISGSAKAAKYHNTNLNEAYKKRVTDYYIHNQ